MQLMRRTRVKAQVPYAEATGEKRQIYNRRADGGEQRHNPQAF